MGDEPQPTAVLTVRIEHSGPIALSALADSLQALADSHARFADASGATINGDKVRLYVREIRSGSIIADLVGVAMNYPIFGTLGTANTVVTFAKHMAALVDYFLGKTPAPPPDTRAEEARELSRIVAPIAGDAAGNLSILARDNASVVVNQTVNFAQANTIQNRARNFAAVQEQPVSGLHEGRLFYWFQARNSEKTKGVGDLGVIESITRKPVKTRFASDEIKRAMLGEALFTRDYVVDVEVQTREGRPTLYTIQRLIDGFEREEPARLPPQDDA